MSEGARRMYGCGGWSSQQVPIACKFGPDWPITRTWQLLLDSHICFRHLYIYFPSNYHHVINIFVNIFVRISKRRMIR